MIDNICFCGHPKKSHVDNYDNYWADFTYQVCHKCAEIDEFDYNCKHEFKTDNLLLLEKLSK